MSLGINASIVDQAVSGLGVYTINVTKALAELYDGISVYTSQPEAFLSTNVQLRRISCALGPTHGKGAHLRRLLWSQVILPRRMVRDQVTVLLSPIPEGPLASSVPHILVVHDLIPLRFPRDYILQWVNFHCYVKLLLRRAQRIIAVSEQTKADMVGTLGIPASQIYVIPGGCDHEVFHPAINSDAVKKKYHLQAYCLYVGNLHPHKNLPRLLQAFHRLGNRIPHQLVIVGKKDPRFFPALQTQVEKLHLREKVVFLDYVPRTDLPGIYAGAEVYILPSLYEGFGLPLIEAMACGKPVVASQTSAMTEVVGQAGMLIDPFNPEEMAEAIYTVLTNPGRRESLTHLGLQQAKKYSWKKTARLISQVFQEFGE